MLTIRNYVRAQSLEEAYELNQKKNNRVMGGMMWLRMGSQTIQTMIDLCDLHLDKIEENDKEFSIGAMVTLRQLELHPSFNAYTKGIASASVKDIVGVQFRNGATVGGSIFGRYGFSDVLTMFLCMDTYVELHHDGIVPLTEFVNMKRNRDILVRLIVKKTPAAFAYQTMRIARTDFPVLTCAVSQVDGEIRTVIGARPGKAVLLKDKNQLLSAGITEESAEAYAAYIAKHISTSSNIRGSATYRTHLAKVLTKRALLEMGGLNDGN